MKQQNHLFLSHQYWKEFLISGDVVIDATCGNGHDTLFLAQLVLDSNGKIFALDIQKEAIENTKKLLYESLPPQKLEQIIFLHQSHEDFHPIPPHLAKLIVYNLGYLPNSNKEIKTQASTTLTSIKKALDLLQQQGAISITCYPGHKEGKIEEKELFSFLQTLPKNRWNICYHQWINKQHAPSLFWIRNIE